jgi:hypothetical protein
MGNYFSVATGVITAAAVYLYFFNSPERKAQGPAGTEHLVRPGDGDYDEQMREQWGGPPPKFYTKCWDEWRKKCGDDCKGKVALITGGTGGIGFYVAKMLAHLGFELILPTRSGFDDETEGAVKAITKLVPGAKIHIPKARLDLESLQSVRDFSKCLKAEWNCLDVLCLNAGRGGSKGDIRKTTADGMEAIMQVWWAVLFHDLASIPIKIGV